MINKLPKVLYWEDEALTILDQTLLPHQVVYEKQTDIKQMWESIRGLKVRGAPAIGVAAAYGCLTGLADKRNLPLEEFKELVRANADYLNTSRPTAVNLSRSATMMKVLADVSPAFDSIGLYGELLSLARGIHDEDIELCDRIGESGMPLITEGCAVLTHCNAGALATTGIGTALAPMYKAHEKGVRFRIHADETRPLLQGARLTAWELMQCGLDVTLNCDNMAADLMSRGKIDLVISGCDRVAANGDGVNKIGTLGVAVLAAHYGIPFYMACPSTTIDMESADGTAMPIEQRDADEVRGFGGHMTAPAGVNVYNPSFDVTPAELITGYIAEKGIIKPPYGKNLKEIFYDTK